MMDRLAAELDKQGIRWQFEPLRLFYHLTSETRRLHCLHPRTRDSHYLRAGFWLHAGNGIAFVGLWSGWLYQIPDASRMAELTFALWDELGRGKQGTPWSLPAGFAHMFSLQACDLFVAFPKNVTDRLDQAEKLDFSPEFSLPLFVEKVAPKVDACGIQEGSLVRVELATASVLCGFGGHRQEPISSYAILLYGQHPVDRDQLHLLNTISEALTCVVYDPAWNNRIHWDDPYYSPIEGESRPESPRNAAPI